MNELMLLAEESAGEKLATLRRNLQRSTDLVPVPTPVHNSTIQYLPIEGADTPFHWDLQIPSIPPISGDLGTHPVEQSPRFSFRAYRWPKGEEPQRMACWDDILHFQLRFTLARMVETSREARDRLLRDHITK